MFRYDKEFAEYQTTDQYKSYLESQNQKDQTQSLNSTPTTNGESKSKKKKKSSVGGGGAPVVSIKEREERNSFDDSDGELSVAEPQRENSNSFDIPIFTEEFLDHNKARELELKQLRKQTGEFEEQNAVLGKHIESMKSAITKLEVETVQQRQSNAALQHQLDQLRQLVVTHFKVVSVISTLKTYFSFLKSCRVCPCPGWESPSASPPRTSSSPRCSPCSSSRARDTRASCPRSRKSSQTWTSPK